MMSICLLFSPDSSGRLFKWQLFFVGKKKRPAEALFLPYKKGSNEKNLERIAGLASEK